MSVNALKVTPEKIVKRGFVHRVSENRRKIQMSASLALEVFTKMNKARITVKSAESVFITMLKVSQSVSLAQAEPSKKPYLQLISILQFAPESLKLGTFLPQDQANNSSVKSTPLLQYREAVTQMKPG